MTATSIISRYNHMNGKPAEISTLRKFLREIQQFMDSEGGGPHAKEINGIRERLAKGLKTMAAKGVTRVNKLNVQVIELSEKKAKPAKTRKPVKKQRKRKSSAQEKVSADLLYGLECIQDDAHLNGTALDGIGDTTYKVITDKILSLMEKDGLIWRQPWNEGTFSGKEGHAHNYVTKHYYRGTNYYLNYLLLNEYDSPYFFTFDQVTKAGGKVKSGEKGNPIIYFKILYQRLTKPGGLVPETEARDENGKLKPGYQKFPALFYYMVFNHNQTTGVKVKPFAAAKKKLTEKEKIESAEQIVKGMPNPPTIKTRVGEGAFYRRSEDLLVMPPIDQFLQEQFYYSTLFHEMIHSTGHQDRVYREREQSRRFGDKKYAFEELIAELGASFLCGESGILYFTLNNSAAYIKSWSSKLKAEMKADPKFFIRAAAEAEKGAEYILGNFDSKKSAKPKAEKATKTKDRKPVKASPPEAKQKPATALSGFTSADQMPETPVDTFKLPGVMGDLLGDLQAYKLEIIVSGETHSSKSELAKQLANAFIKAGHDVAYIDWEHGGLQSKDTQAGIQRNIEAGSKNKLFVNGDLPRTLEAVKDLAKHFKVIILDSGTKIKGQITNAWIDDLRESEPGTIWIVTMQQNEKGGTRGGSAAEFDAPVVVKTYRDDINDYRKNYAVVEKNRGNSTGTRYNISSKKIEKQIAPKKEAA